MKYFIRQFALIGLTTFYFVVRPEAALSLDFQAAESWKFLCEVESVDKYRNKGTYKFSIFWKTKADVAKIIWQSGNGKEMRTIPGFVSASGQHSVHFWHSKATKKYTSEHTKNSKYGGFIDGLGATLFSIRASGEMARTNHDIIYGGMKPLSEVGICKISSVD
jgi:hypothetical protein